MVNRKRNVESGMPTLDESWWESVLSEEGDRPGRSSGRGRSAGMPRKEARSEAGTGISPNWEHVKQLFSDDGIVSLRVTACNRGGLLVEGEDLAGFVPFSHLLQTAGGSEPAERGRLMESYVGRTLRLKVIECAPDDGRVVFSERAAQAEPGRRAELFQSLHVGDRTTGTVTNITDFGVFVDLGGVEGLIHISELSWGRVVHPAQVAGMGDVVDVQVLDVSPERCRVALSLKRLQPNPWEQLGAELLAAPAVPAVITSVLSYGAFARLDSGVEGLIHASEMPLVEGQGVKEYLHEGQGVRVRVLHIDTAHQRMGLSMKHVED
jgi:small subunit ribosomal protein S1